MASPSDDLRWRLLLARLCLLLRLRRLASLYGRIAFEQLIDCSPSQRAHRRIRALLRDDVITRCEKQFLNRAYLVLSAGVHWKPVPTYWKTKSAIATVVQLRTILANRQEV